MKSIYFQTNNMSIPGGAERVISIWANYFSNIYNVKVVSGSKGKSFYNLNRNIEEIFCDFKPKFRILPFYRLYNIFKLLRRLKKGDVLIVNKYNFVNSIWIFRKLGFFNNIKLIYFAHGGVSDFKYFYKKYRVKKIFKSFDYVISLYDDCNFEIESINNSKIRIVNNPSSFVTQKKCDYKSKNILVVGRLAQEKGLDKLLRIWSKVDRKDYKLVIVGDGPMKEELISLSKELDIYNSVKFEGAQEDVLKYYLESSIYLMTSLYEGMPMVLLEAMECGLPILAYANKGVSNLINNVGIIIKEDNEESFIENLNKLIEDEKIRKILGSKSLNASQLYRIENISKNFIKIIEE